MAPVVHGGIAAEKIELFQRYGFTLRGKVLELGPGTGSNFDFFPKNGSMSWIGVEPNAYMIDDLRLNMERAGFGGANGSVVHATAEDYLAQLDNNSIDTVISTFVLCSVHQQSAIVSELARVLKPGGNFLLIEHIASESPRERWYQEYLTPLWSVYGDNCHLNRPTNELFDDGFPDPWAFIQLQKFDLPSPFEFLRPAILGYVQKIDHSKYSKIIDNTN